ncbi:hypothetical protein B0H13DRAFT_2312193 [Mycena leptocephala]|nr:hypothetical protein B0H13DRAFT_2312193 [Mycena leptocephala]
MRPVAAAAASTRRHDLHALALSPTLCPHPFHATPLPILRHIAAALPDVAALACSLSGSRLSSYTAEKAGGGTKWAYLRCLFQSPTRPPGASLAPRRFKVPRRPFSRSPQTAVGESSSHCLCADRSPALRTHIASIVGALLLPSILTDDLVGIPSSSLTSSTTEYTRAYPPPSTPRSLIPPHSQFMVSYLRHVSASTRSNNSHRAHARAYPRLNQKAAAHYPIFPCSAPPTNRPSKEENKRLAHDDVFNCGGCALWSVSFLPFHHFILSLLTYRGRYLLTRLSLFSLPISYPCRLAVGGPIYLVSCCNSLHDVQSATRLPPAPKHVSRDSTAEPKHKACYKCGVEGHISRGCPENAGASSGGRAAFSSNARAGGGAGRSVIGVGRRDILRGRAGRQGIQLEEGVLCVWDGIFYVLSSLRVSRGRIQESAPARRLLLRACIRSNHFSATGMRSLCFGVRVLWRAIPLGLTRFIPPHLRCALQPSRCPALARAPPCSPLEATEKGTFFWTPLPHFLLSFSPAGGETGLRCTGPSFFHRRAGGPQLFPPPAGCAIFYFLLSHPSTERHADVLLFFISSQTHARLEAPIYRSSVSLMCHEVNVATTSKQ